MRITNTRAFRRILSAALTLVMALSLAVPAFAASTTCDPGCPVCSGATRTSARDAVATTISFSDVPGTHTFFTGINWCAEKGIIGGYADGTFRPSNTVTRSNFTVMLSRAFYADDVAYYGTLANITQYGSFYPNYWAMMMNRALDGTSFENVQDIRSSAVMNKGINRYDMAQLMTNIMRNNNFSASSSDKNAAIAKISDYSSIPSQYKDAVANVYALGIISGYSDGSFGGEVTMNRGQAAIVIYRMMQKMYPDGEIGTPDPEAPVDPSTGDMACACVTLNGECKCCNTTSSAGGNTGNTGNTGTTTPTTPTTPSTGTLTLRDGSAVTEANALKIIEQVKQAFPYGTKWDGNTWRSENMTIGGRKLGSVTGNLGKIELTYGFSINGGCGGFASLVSDAIFGGDNGKNFPVRKLDSVADVRPGDIIVRIDATTGITKHFAVVESSVISSKTARGVTVYEVNRIDGNMNEMVTYTNGYIFDDAYNNSRYEAWTRWPA